MHLAICKRCGIAPCCTLKTVMRSFAGALTLLLLLGWLLLAQTSQQGIPAVRSKPAAGPVTAPADRKPPAEMKIESAELVPTLFKVRDTYSTDYDEPFCATNSVMDSQEGKRHHE